MQLLQRLIRQSRTSIHDLQMDIYQLKTDQNMYRFLNANLKTKESILFRQVRKVQRQFANTGNLNVE